ncbi:hypothetical protein BH23ACT6_BH23ACT6_07630 [soil metagenome]
MARMYDSQGDDDRPDPGDQHPGLQKSYHMQLADRMDQQAGGTSWPSFMRTRWGAVIAVVLVVSVAAILVMLGTGGS